MGRLGLQTDGGMAVFSVLDAVGAAGPGASRSIDGGWSCQVPYPWRAGRRYQLRVGVVEPGWWGASVADDSAETEVGFIQVPPDWRQLDTPSLMMTEYRGSPLASCAEVPHSRVVFSAPTADDGSTAPERMHSVLGDGTCDCSRAESVPGGVRHEIGWR